VDGAIGACGGLPGVLRPAPPGRGSLLIRVLLAMPGALTRGAMAALLGQQDDIDVVAESAQGPDTLAAATRHQPDVVVLHTDLPAANWRAVCAELSDSVPGSHVLVLVDVQLSGRVWRGFPRWASQVGFMVDEPPPARLVEAIRRLSHGDRVLDPELALAALIALDNPFTMRELEVLKLAARGAPASEIAGQLSLAIGTVRNHLSRIIAKTGARTRIEAIRIAQDAGWL
jgi:two-component system, NarL family, response regulator DesR